MQLLAWIADLFWPLTCLGCQHVGARLCRACQATLQGKTHTSIIEDMPVVAAGTMRTPLLSRSIWELKYKNAKHLAPALGALMASSLSETHPPTSTLVPVPLHQRRLRTRGYNQSALLAHQVARIAAWPTADLLVRQRPTKSQVETTSREDRLQNMQNAFHIREGSILPNKVILVDDVCTTGATLLACKTALLRAGVKKVLALVAARG